jgi:SAM-dependent methyltransferase
MKSNEYWLNKAGSDYAYQQQQRSLHGNKSYRQQENWLVEHLQEIAERHGKALRVLDFGCGFGRFARLLSKLDFVDYFGYDFSGSMVDPLLHAPQEGLADDLVNRIRIAPSVREAYPTEEFDVVFTCSVLIHNPSVVAKQLLADMSSIIASDGETSLVATRPPEASSAMPAPAPAGLRRSAARPRSFPC